MNVCWLTSAMLFWGVGRLKNIIKRKHENKDKFILKNDKKGANTTNMTCVAF
ncbi:hypothetical protein DPMN_039808 [Dreissena polymorpha]|uniref:Uncharacterized protein n=1 Tax=Dreissena polymorpha TaxID=45954 RepID=A0A9D4CU15_DREPO|nr:hypothetical protein DPMN_039808 [Dreissena polymorpha]